MLQTFDFIRCAWKNDELMLKLMDSMKKDVDSEVHTECHRIRFRADIRKVEIFPLSETSPFHWKVIPKQMTYSALLQMLHKDLEHFKDDDIVDIDCCRS